MKEAIAEKKMRLEDLLQRGMSNVAISKEMGVTPIAAGNLLLNHFGTKSAKEAREKLAAE